jgi:DNA-binding transcriptional regulator YiaG
METHIEETYEDWSLGFPVVLHNVPLAHVRGDMALNINANEYQRIVLWLLAHRSTRLTGLQVRFVRHWMENTLADFAELVGMTSHQSVMKWEAKGHELTGMHKSTEVLLRCRILEALDESIWRRFGANEPGKAGFVHRMEGVSSFGNGVEPTAIELEAAPPAADDEHTRWRPRL